MVSKIMQVFYGTDCLPYKDKERSVHYPITGNSFVGASNVTQIRFYIDQIGSREDTWVANSKLPNGKLGNKILNTYYDEELDEWYALLEFSSFYTQAKGDVYISLNGFVGGVTVEYDSESEQYSIEGIPTIQATGVIKIPVYYATPLIGNGQEEVITLQSLLAALGLKLDKNSNFYFKVIDGISNINDSDYQGFFGVGDIVYSKESTNPFQERRFYKITGGEFPNFTWEEIADFSFKEPSITSGSFYLNSTFYGYVIVNGYSDVRDSNGKTLPTYIQELIDSASDTYVTLATEQTITGHKTFTTTITANSGINFGNGASVNMYNGLIKNNVAKLFAIGTSEDNRTYYAFPYGSVSGSTHGSNNPYILATEYYVQDYAYAKANTYTKNEVDALLSSVYKPQGTKTVAQINALTPTSEYNGYVYNVSDSGNITIGTQGSLSVVAGDNVVLLWDAENNTYSFDKLAGTIDLSAYATITYVDTQLGLKVSKTTTIASIDLSSNISAQALTDALVFMNTTTDIDYVMED